MYKYFIYIMLFFIYSFIGYIMEVMVCLLYDKKLINRGFLIGPLVPIYGFGSMFIITFLSKINNIFLVFILSIIICSLLEYIISYLMEKLFNARWWDYSKRKYNLNGRICLRNSLAFGLLGILLIYIVNPLLVDIVYIINPTLLKVLTSLFMILFIFDTTLSFIVTFKIKGVSKDIFKDSTEEINEKVKEVLLNKGLLTRRVIKAYPDYEVKFKSKIKEIRDKF